MNFIEITFSKVKKEIEDFLSQEYSKADLLYSNASPYGQILLVVENLFQLSFLYLKNSINQFDMGDVNSLNERVIKNEAILAGHIPSRAISATGTLLLTIKAGSDVITDVPGGRITIFDKQALKNKTNGYDYAINLGSDKSTYKVNNGTQFFLPIIQGKWQKTTFTGTGQPNQTYQVTIRGSQKEIENFNYNVLVDGVYWPVKKHLYDLLPDEPSCVIKTGFNGGIDVIFGNSGYGAIPDIGSIIEVNYLVSDGAVGNIFRRTANDWTFVDTAIDGNGNSLDITKIFDIRIHTDINFGADRESILFTKNVLPIVSPNFVLGLPQQYAYQIKRLGVFSHVNAYEKFGTIYIVATPNINLFKGANGDYFSIDKRAFLLDSYETSKIDTYLKTAGTIRLTQRYTIGSPVLSYYVMYIFIMQYSDAIDDNVNAAILGVISDYFLNLLRVDRIPKADLVSKISALKDIYSVDITFVCKNNEDYHAKGKQTQANKVASAASKININNLSPRTNPNYDPKKLIGIDGTLGDILFEPSEIPIIRGGWYDRNGVYYSDNIDDAGLKSVNIVKKGTIDAKNRPQI